MNYLAQKTKEGANSISNIDIIEKEVDMGFFNNHYFVMVDGVLKNNSCQRVEYCSCDCNRCTIVVL